MRAGARPNQTPLMVEGVRVRVAASPRLLHDLVARNIAGAGVDVTTAADTLVSVVTPDHVEQATSRVVIVLCDGGVGDVHVLLDGQISEDRRVDDGDLRALVLDLADRISHDGPLSMQ